MGKYNINTPIHRVAYWTGWEGKANDAGELRYGHTMLFEEGETLADIKAMATDIMTEKFGADKSKWPKKFSKPWKDQGDHDAANPDRDPESKPYDGYKLGNLCLTSNVSKDPPEVVDNRNQAILEKRKVYSGCYGIANIDLFWFESKNKQGVVTNKGITCAVNCFQKLKDGEPLGNSRPQAASVFKPVAVDTKKGAAAVFADDDAEDPMA